MPINAKFLIGGSIRHKGTKTLRFFLTTDRHGLTQIDTVFGQLCVLDTTNSPNAVCAIGPYLVHKTDCVVLRHGCHAGRKYF